MQMNVENENVEIETIETIEDANCIIKKFKDIYLIETNNEKDKLRIDVSAEFYIAVELTKDGFISVHLDTLDKKKYNNLNFKYLPQILTITRKFYILLVLLATYKISYL